MNETPNGLESMVARAQSGIYGILVTYRRPEQLRRSLNALLPLAEAGITRLYVVDNDPEESGREVVEELGLPHEPISYLASGSNLGPAGGWAIGMKAAMDEANNDDWIAVFDDDDPLPDRGLLRELAARACESGIYPLGAISLGGNPVNLRFLSPSKKRVSRSDLEYVHKIDEGFFPLISVEALRDVGTFDCSLFFGYEGLDLGIRLTNAGYPILKSSELRRLYTGSLEANFHTKSDVRSELHPSGPKLTLQPPNWRRYYALRNELVLGMRYGSPLIAIGQAVLKSVVKPIVNIPISPAIALAHLSIGLDALRDGMTGSLGRNERYLPTLEVHQPRKP